MTAFKMIYVDLDITLPTKTTEQTMTGYVLEIEERNPEEKQKDHRLAPKAWITIYDSV